MQSRNIFSLVEISFHRIPSVLDCDGHWEFTFSPACVGRVQVRYLFRGFFSSVGKEPNYELVFKSIILKITTQRGGILLKLKSLD